MVNWELSFLTKLQTWSIYSLTWSIDSLTWSLISDFVQLFFDQILKLVSTTGSVISRFAFLSAFSGGSAPQNDQT